MKTGNFKISIRAIVLVLTSVVVLAGCANAPTSFIAQVPTTGPIEQGQLVTNTSADQFIRVIARPPQPGMSPSEIVQGFLDASASFDGNHAVARTYLTPEAASDWNPSSGVSVYEGLPTLVEAGAAVLMSSALTGRISANGRYTVESPGSEITTSFFLTQRGGEWRISRPPGGLLLSSFDVSRAYRSYSIYFFNPSFTTLVPDPRLIPVIGPALATNLVQRLIEGPNNWLKPAVRSGFPAGVGLAVDAVTIENGIASVNLDQSVLLSSDDSRVALSQQIVWTLRQLPEVQAVEILAGGTPLSVPGVESPQPRDAWPSVDPSGLPRTTFAVVATPSGVLRLTSEGNFAVPGAFGEPDLGIAKLALSQDSSELSAIDSRGRMIQGRTLVGATLNVQGNGQDAQSLTYDRNVGLWFVDALGRVSSMSTRTGEVFPIAVSGLDEGSLITGVYPSRDGTRAAIVVESDLGSNLLMTRVTRPSAANITRITLQAPIRVESKLTEIVDVAWSSANSLAVIGGESAGALQVYEIDLSRGDAAAQGSPEDPVDIAAAPGLPTLIGSANGNVYENSTGIWVERVIGVSPTYPG